MNPPKNNSELVQKTIDFHGHWCPGLAIGIRAAELALNEIGKASDEEIVAVVETDMCGVDAIQYLTGCTLGKGNLIHKDYGKNAFTFYRRRDNKALRLVTRREIFAKGAPLLTELNRKVQEEGLTAEEEKKWKEIRDDIAKRVMEADLSEIFEVKTPSHPMPKKARMVSSLLCESCGEGVMETRTRRLGARLTASPVLTLSKKGSKGLLAPGGDQHSKCRREGHEAHSSHGRDEKKHRKGPFRRKGMSGEKKGED